VGAAGVLSSYLERQKTIASDRLVREFGMEVGRTTMNMDYEILESPAVGELRSRMHNDRQWGAGFQSVIRQTEGVSEGILGVLTGVVLLLPMLVSIGDISVFLFVVFISLFSLITAVIQARVINKRNLKMIDEYTASGAFFGHFIWQSLNIADVKDIHLYRADGLIRKHVDQKYDQKKSWITRYALLHMTGGFAGSLAIGLIQLGASVFIILRAAAASLPVGSVMLYIAAFTSISTSLSRLAAAAASLSLAAARQKSTLDYLKSDTAPKTESRPLKPQPVHEIAFEHVSYRYPGRSDYAIKDVSFTVGGHSHIALVGLNGSGKSTLIKLLCGLIEPTEGRILLDGTDARLYDPKAYRALFGIVFQDSMLLPFTLGENVGAGQPDMERAEAALKLSGFQERLKRLLFGLNTPLYNAYDERGIDVSGGESQKIAIARALYRDAPFMVLDEPTATLDPLSECALYEKFYELTREKAVVIVSHRLSCGHLANETLVFRDGAIVERGDHNTLLSHTDSEYYRLWESQLC
jgi:ATP-binding cassette subfamily B protein